jgi:ribonucleotide reductase beta subunit family protein with ferritin-like domain
MNSDSMCDYLEYVADCLLVGLGYGKRYNKQNPYEFMKNIGMQSKTNFFEARPTSYSSAYSQGRAKGKLETLDDDF